MPLGWQPGRDHLAQSLSLGLKKPVLREVQETVRAAGTQPGPVPWACSSTSPGLGLPRHQSQGQAGPDSGTRNPCEDTAGPGAACPQLKLLHSGRDPAPHLLCARPWGHRPERHRAVPCSRVGELFPAAGDTDAREGHTMLGCRAGARTQSRPSVFPLHGLPLAKGGETPAMKTGNRTVTCHLVSKAGQFRE